MTTQENYTVEGATITKQDFEDYERVRAGGRWNMFDPNAQRATGLNRETYLAVMWHYMVLMEKWPDVRKERK